MTKSEQIEFVQTLSSEIVSECIKAIVSDILPGHWTRNELRVWLADRHADSARMTYIQRKPRSKRAHYESSGDYARDKIKKARR